MMNKKYDALSKFARALEKDFIRMGRVAGKFVRRIKTGGNQ